jgi:hypothetical protein
MSAAATVGTVTELMNVIRDLKDRTTSSLTEYSKKTMIISRAYIEDTLAREDGIQNIMKFMNQMLGGFVLTSIGLNDVVSGGRTVRQLASMISTEDFHNFLDVIDEEFGDKNVKISVALEDNSGSDNKQTQEVTIKDVKSDPTLYAGRLLEVNITGDNGAKVPLYFYVQVIPYTIPTAVMEQFVSTTYKPTFWSRWMKFKAGEIRFWKDFLFECDLVRKRRKALKADKAGILREIEDNRRNQLTREANNYNPFATANHNAASSLIVVSRKTMDRLMKDEGLDYRNYKVRQNIMSAAMCMMMAVFDPNYGTVDLYLNGINHAGNYSIDHIKESVGKNGDKDAVDLKTLMTLLASGSAPRF